jgi:hypothetical protein
MSSAMAPNQEHIPVRLVLSGGERAGLNAKDIYYLEFDAPVGMRRQRWWASSHL